MTRTIVTNAESTGEHPVVLASPKPQPTPREPDLAARVAELEAQTQHSIEWAVVFSAGDVHDYSTEALARSTHASLELPPENLLCRHVRRGPWTAVQPS